MSQVAPNAAIGMTESRTGRDGIDDHFQIITLPQLRLGLVLLANTNTVAVVQGTNASSSGLHELCPLIATDHTRLGSQTSLISPYQNVGMQARFQLLKARFNLDSTASDRSLGF